MGTFIREMTEDDRNAVLAMMRIFYRSPAVMSNGSEEIFTSDFENCIGDCPFLEGYIFEGEQENTHHREIQGYAMIAKSFSTEFGSMCIWIEDIYICKAFRGLGIGRLFMEYIENQYPDRVFRLEVEEENDRAVRLYKSQGYSTLPYMEMIRMRTEK